jgi:hypothetical protein
MDIAFVRFEIQCRTACLAVDFSNLLVVHPGVPATTLAEYLDLGPRLEGMDYGTSGVGSAAHLTGELLKRAAAPG